MVVNEKQLYFFLFFKKGVCRTGDSAAPRDQPLAVLDIKRTDTGKLLYI